MSQRVKDLQKRKLYGKYELERLQLLALIHNSRVSEQAKTQCVQQLNRLPRNSSLARSRNRCLLTGRGRGIYRFCRMSRIMVRELGSKGRIMGLRKSSW